MNLEKPVVGSRGEDISPLQLKSAIVECGDALEIFGLWEAQRITMSISEYLLMPATFIEAYGIYCGVRKKNKQERAEKLNPGL